MQNKAVVAYAAVCLVSNANPTGVTNMVWLGGQRESNQKTSRLGMATPLLREGMWALIETGRAKMIDRQPRAVHLQLYR